MTIKLKTIASILKNSKHFKLAGEALKLYKKDYDRVSKLMDREWYKKQYPDIDFSLNDPVTHYFNNKNSGRSPHILFDPSWYAKQLTEFRHKNEDLFIHFLNNKDPSKTPHPLFDSLWYLQHYQDVKMSGQNALEHFINFGASEGRNPHPLFDTERYRRKNRLSRSKTALVHYLQLKGHKPHPLFDEKFYRNQIKDIDFDNTSLLLHFVTRGAAAGYNPNPLFDCIWYTNNHENLGETGENPLAHFVRLGFREGRDPHPQFDVDWYLHAYPDAIRSGLNPLHHFLSVGRAEGHKGHPADASSESCAVLEIPYELRRNPTRLKDRNVCIFVTYSHDGIIFPHVESHVSALHDNNIDVILVIATDGLDRELPPFTECVAGLVVRINHGWDFAAWATALSIIPEVWLSRSLILTNDSIFGPTDSDHYRKLLNRIDKSKAGVVALTDSYQTQHHMMSYFTVLKPKALKSQIIHNFWNSVISISNKNEVIARYETRSIDLLRNTDIGYEILYPTENSYGRAKNPTLEGWRELLEDGFPFIKVQLIRDSARLGYSDTTGWRTEIGKNKTLLKSIEDYIEFVQNRSTASLSNRPVPRPRMRFNRSSNLATFYGAVPSTRPTERSDLCLEVPFRKIQEPMKLPHKVAVIAHIFYPEICSEMRTAISNIPVSTDLFISTDTIAKKTEIEQQFVGFNGNVTVTAFPNVGRDLAPMIVGYASVFEEYDVFLHVHSKKSPHASNLLSWRSFLFKNLLGSREIVSSILALLTETDVGIVFSDHYPPVRSLLNWGGNYRRAKSILGEAGINISKDYVLDFPSGSFFWGRSEAIRPLLKLKLGWDDFDAEAGQIDGTLAHSIERSILYIAESQGFSWTKVGTVNQVSARRLVPAWSAGDVSATQQRLLGNRVPPLADRNLVPELISICTKSEKQNPRPRLNLVIPTLAPEHIFGGITTALRIFEEVAAALGPDYDLRIIVQSLPIDLRAMVGFPEYRLVAMGMIDDLPKVIVDISDQESGELSIRRGDIFLATAWWTAVSSFDFQIKQNSYFGKYNKVIYLIQDHEPEFYGWSTQYAVAQQTYSHGEDMIALINSEELATFITGMYSISDAYMIPFKINPEISNSLQDLQRERIICVYGRPGTPRNAFPLLCAGINQWQRNNPDLARNWRIVAAGEPFSPDLAASMANLSVVGKLSLDQYGELLSKASVGISLMLSPHPSYPPLEMASAGVKTITNNFTAKNLSLRHPNIISIKNITPQGLSEALEQAVIIAEKDIGKIMHRSALTQLPCEIPEFDARLLAERIRAMMALPL